MRWGDKLRSRQWSPRVRSACAVILFYVLLTHLDVLGRCLLSFLNFFLPIILGVCIAYILNPLVGFVQGKVSKRVPSKRAGRGISVTVAVVLLLAFLSALIGTLIPQLFGSITTLIGNLDGYIRQLQSLLATAGTSTSELSGTLDELVSNDNSVLNRATAWISNNISQILRTSVSIGADTFNWVVSFILAVYFMLEHDRMRGGVKHLLQLVMPERAYMRGCDLWRRFEKMFVRYIQCELLDALLVGFANYIFMKITAMPYALLISTVVGVTNLAPTFGPVVGAVIGAFILLLVDPVLMLWFLIFTIILQTVDGYVIKPKLFGNVLNVPSILILITIIVGGRMFGVVGILLAIPCAGMLEYLYREILIPRLEERKAAREAAPTDNGRGISQ